MNDSIFDHLKSILEAAIFASTDPLSLSQLQQLFEESYCPTLEQIKEALDELKIDYTDRGITLIEVASGFRFQSRLEYAHYLQRLWQKKPPKYSRALLETLAIIAYKQPITRGEIEEIRGIAVSTDIIKKLLDREWIKMVGTKDVPGKPALYSTTQSFLDYFSLKSITELPDLPAPKAIEPLLEETTAELTLIADTVSEEVVSETVTAADLDPV